MKNRHYQNRFLAAITLAGFAFTAPSTFAASLYWDSNGTGTAGAGATPTGNWGTDAFWTTDSTGANIGSPVLVTNGTNLDDYFFSAGTDAVNAYTVSLNDAARTPKSVTFEDGTVTITGGGASGKLTITHGGGITVADTTVTGATISSDLQISGNCTFNVGDGRTLTLDGTTFTRSSRATLNVQGNGIVISTMGNLNAVALSNGILGPWASLGTGASTTYATIDGSDNIVAYTSGTAAATAADVTDTSGILNYDVADVGTLGAGANVNTLRYTGATGAIVGDLSTKGIMNASSSGVNVSFSGAVTAGASGNELVINAANGSIGLNGIVTGAIVKTGSGTATLSGTPVHVLGTWTVNQGVLALNGAVTPVTNAENIPGGTVNGGGTVKLMAGNKVANGAVFTINAGGNFDLNGQGDLIGGISGSGSVINTGVATPTFQLGNTTQTFSGVISGAVNLRKRNGGDQILSGANTFTGTTALTNPNTTPGTKTTLTLANPLALQNSALDTTTSVAGTVDYGLRTTVTTLTLGGLTGSKDLASVFRQDASGGPLGDTALGGYSGITALTLNPAVGVTRTYTAIIADGAPGMPLTKTGAGTQVLSGINSYTGATAVNGGTLLVNSPGSLAATTAVTVAGGASLGGNGTINGTVNLASGALLAPGGAGTIGTLTLANNSASSLTLNGNALLFDLPNAGTTCDLIDITGASGQLSLNGANFIVLNAPSGVVPEGTYTLMNYSGQTGSGTLTFQNGTTTFGNATLTVGPTSVTLTVGVGGLNLGLDTWSGSVSGVWDGGILNWTKNGTVSSAYADGDAVTFDDSGSNTATISSGAPVSPASVFFNNNSKNYTVSAVIAGTTTLAKTGAATTTLTGNNTYTGATIISGGTLQISGAGRLNTGNYSGAMNLGNGAAFEQNASGLQTLSGNVTGTGGILRVIGGAGLALSGAGNSFGTLNINNAATRVFINTNAGALPAAATANVSSGLLVFGTGASYSSTINVSSGAGIATRNSGGTSLTGTVTLPGSGAVIFNNDDSSTYELTIASGQTLSGNLTVQVGGTRMTAGTGTLGGATLAGKLTGSGSLTMTSSGGGSNPLTGTGKLTLTGPNDYTGDTTVNSGVLALTGDSIADAGKLLINGGGIVDLTGTEAVAALDFDGTPQPSGDYSATSVPPGAAITTASFTGSGTLTVGGAGASNYASWASSQVPPITGGPNGDDDNDGVKNLIEYALADGQERGTLTGKTLSFTKRGAPWGTDLSYAIETSEDLGLGDTWQVVTPDVNNATTISFELQNPGDNFGRLKVIQTTP